MPQPMQPQLDKDSIEYIQYGERLKKIIQSDAWQLVKDLINESLADLESIRHVTGKTAEDRDIDLKARVAASDILREIMNGTEAAVNQYDNNKNLLDKSYIERL